MPFIEALGQFSYRVGEETCVESTISYNQLIISVIFTRVFLQINLLTGPDNFCVVHVSLVPVLNEVGEQVRGVA